jgi:hypothetical protein
MEPIDSQALSSVRGGFGAILGALLQAAPTIMQGVSGIISASKGGGGNPPTTTAQLQPPATGPTSAAPSQPPTQLAAAPSGGGCRCCSDMLGAASVQNIVRIGA